MNDESPLTARSVFYCLLDFLFPPVCQICKQGFVGDNIWLCERCRAALAVLPDPYCPVCREFLQESERNCGRCRRRVAIKWIYSLGTYDDYFSRLILAFKYAPKPGMGALLGRMLADRLARLAHLQTIDAVCFIPLYHRKASKRGFNQSELLAREIAERLGVEFYHDQLIQIRKNRDQIGLSIEERFRNVHGIYQTAPAFRLAGKSVLLVDDVTTSGATLNEAAMVLKAAGAEQVAAATVAAALEEGISPQLLYALLGDQDNSW